ncbi:MAG: hypothetical protein WB716_11730 [Candidatus Acidiferrales bacterium]
MRKPLLSRGPLVFVATCFVCLLASSVSGQILKLPTPPAPAPKPSTTSIPILKLPTVPSKEVKSVPATARVPLIEDLSSRHIIFSKPANAQQAAQLQQDPRFLQQFLLRNHSAPSSSNKLQGIWARLLDRQRVRRDWAVSLGAGGGVAPGMYAAKYTFDVTAFPSCTADFAVFPINAPTGNSRASVTGNFTAEPTSGDTFSITITPTGATLTLIASTFSNTGLDFLISPTLSTDASNLAAAINRNLSTTNSDRIVAVASGDTVTVYALTPGDGEALTDGTTSGEFSWIVSAPGFNGSQANIVAFNELYSGSSAKCSAQPHFIFSYASGVGPVATSPTLSLDGTEIAYVENDPYIGAILHVLTYGTGTEYGSCSNGGVFPPDCATAPVIPGSTAGSTATDTMLPLGLLTVNAATGAAGATDTFSSPYIHYGFDTLYVGDDNGYLYAIYPTFTATPAHAGGNFPVSLIAPAVSESPTSVTAVHSTGVVTVTVSSTTGLGIGELVTIAGVAARSGTCSVLDPAEINGTWTIASIPSGTTFTFDTMIPMTTSPPGCTVTAATVTPGTSYVSAPSLDGNITGNLFVGDSSGNLYMVSSAGVQATLSLGSVANGGIRGGPIVDSTNSVGYAVAACSGGNAALTQFSFTATTMTKAASAQLESSGAGCTVAGLPTYDPTPDARYFDLGIGSATAASNGELIAAASAGGGQNINTFQFVGSVMQTPPEATSVIGTAPSAISPLTEFFNNTFITSSMSSVMATQGTPGVVTVMAHNSLSPGDVVLISGVAADGDCDANDVAGINGMPTVTSATATQFTFNATIPDPTGGPCNDFSATAVGGPDYMFMGVAQDSTELYSFFLPSGALSGTPAMTNTSDADGGTSGIIIDNDDAVDGQTASLYYGTLATSGVCSGNYCAIKVTQAMLQ